jgi:hypothetical protein
MKSRPPFAIVIFAGLIAFALAAGGQEPPQPPPPTGPNMTAVTPCVLQPGSTTELTLSGSNLTDPVSVWASFAAKITIPTDKDNGKDGKTLRVLIEVPKDTPLGYQALRVATARGVTNLRIICIDELPIVHEAESNQNRSTPQVLSAPCVVCAKVAVEKSDFYLITAKADERMSFEVIGRRLGNPFDPQISLIDSRTGKELAYSNDSPGLQTDARLTYTFKEAGNYLLEIRDVQWRGGPEFAYCLRVGDFPCATTPLPMMAKKGTRTLINFAGPHVEGVAPVEVAMPKDTEVVSVVPRFANGVAGWPVALTAGDFDEIVEYEPNNDAAKANRVPLPVGITARFAAKNDIDHFVFSAKKGQRWIIQIQTHELHSPTEVLMTLKDAKGKQVSVSNPQGEPRIDFNASADGDYTLSVEHLLYWGGPDESYRLTIERSAPGFELVLGTDRLELPPSGYALLPIQNIVRRNYNGPIDVSVVGPDGLTGRITIPAASDTTRRTPPEAGAEAAEDGGAEDGAPFMRRSNNPLFVSADEKIKTGFFPVTVHGTAMIDGKPVTVRGSVRSPLARSLSNLPFPPLNLLHQEAVAITEKPPFSLTAKFDAAEYLRGKPAGVTVTAARAPGFTEEIALAGVALPANVEAELKAIPKDQNEVKTELKPETKAPVGQFRISFTGKAKHQEKEYTVMAAPVVFIIAPPFDLKVEPTPFKLAAGGKAKLKVTATRKLGYDGPIDLELRNLPKNVTAAKANIAADKSEAELEVTATDKAALGEKKGVTVRGTATKAGDQTHSSPEFTLTIQRDWRKVRLPIIGLCGA